jgi:hypothetical protein
MAGVYVRRPRWLDRRVFSRPVVQDSKSVDNGQPPGIESGFKAHRAQG